MKHLYEKNKSRVSGHGVWDDGISGGNHKPPAVANAETVTINSGYPTLSESNCDAHHMRTLYMTSKKYTNIKTQAESERELKRDMIADRELDDTENYHMIKALMDKIEEKRKELKKTFPEFTQKKLAKKAGIGLSTYKDYLSGFSDNISLKTVIKIAHILQCKLSDLLEEH